MTAANENGETASALAPGALAAAEMEARAMTLEELANGLGKSVTATKKIMQGKRVLSLKTALRLEKALGVDAAMWLDQESRYRVALARERAQDRQAVNQAWVREYPIRDMAKRGWIDAGRDLKSRWEALYAFLGTAELDPERYLKAQGLRVARLPRDSISTCHLAVWLRQGEREAHRIATARFTRKGFRQALAGIRHLTWQEPAVFLPALRYLCADAGVAFCLVPALPTMGATGAARWLRDGSALLQMSVQRRRGDRFWQSFFRHAYHLLQHRKQSRCLLEGAAQDPKRDKLAREADQFAQNFLIPAAAWKAFSQKHAFRAKAIEAYARSLGIAPFIVVERLERDGRIAYSAFRSLRRSYHPDQGFTLEGLTG